jgi:hypothetical protein
MVAATDGASWGNPSSLRSPDTTPPIPHAPEHDPVRSVVARPVLACSTVTCQRQSRPPKVARVRRRRRHGDSGRCALACTSPNLQSKAQLIVAESPGESVFGNTGVRVGDPQREAQNEATHNPSRRQANPNRRLKPTPLRTGALALVVVCCSASVPRSWHFNDSVRNPEMLAPLAGELPILAAVSADLTSHRPTTPDRDQRTRPLRHGDVSAAAHQRAVRRLRYCTEGHCRSPAPCPAKEKTTTTTTTNSDANRKCSYDAPGAVR